MLDTSKRSGRSGWWLAGIVALIVLATAADGVAVKHPRASGNGTVLRDDLTTDLAKRIMRRSKAADIKSLLNPRVAPCDDFYQYACGNWHRHNPAQLFANVMTDRFQMLAQTFDRRLERLLTRPGHEAPLEHKVKNFYRACQVVRRDVVLYQLELENVYKEFGELPVLAGDDWTGAKEFKWWETVARIQHKYGKQIILALDIMSDYQNNTENRVYIGPPDFQMSNGNTKLIALLHEASTAKDLQQYFGVESALAKRTAKEMIAFERALVEGGEDERSGVQLQDMLTLQNVTDLQARYNGTIDVRRYLELVLGGAEAVPDEIYVYDEKYWTGMLRTIGVTPQRTLVNYVLWQLLQAHLVDTSDDQLSKWCIDRTKQYFGRYIDQLVYANYRSEATEREVEQMWHEIREAFRAELSGDKLDWMANKTREYAIEKLDNMRLLINSYAEENFTAVYANLSIDPLRHVQNIQQIMMLEAEKARAKLHQPPSTIEDPETLSFTPAYNILENNIKIPVALLQPHYFWDINYPQALKYATLGYLIAHEMVHGFDDDGRNYDKVGNFRSWWDAKSTYEFEARRKCFTAQYHNYRYGGRQLPESVAQAENIADNAGIKLAYAAYMRWLQAQPDAAAEVAKSETLPDLELDNRKLFFVGFAQVWCDDVQSLFRSSVASSDTHAPGMYRVIGSLSNFQEFSWVFECKPDAPMDPEFKCAIY